VCENVNDPASLIDAGFVHGIGLVREAVRRQRGSSPNQVPGTVRSPMPGGPMAPLVNTALCRVGGSAPGAADAGGRHGEMRRIVGHSSVGP
jgi:hypothetical protein